VVKEGRFGPYVTDGTTNASLRKGDDVESITMERAAELLAERRAAGPSTRKKAGAKRAGATKKAAKKSTTAKKAGGAKKAAGTRKAAAKKATGAKKAGATKKVAAERAEPLDPF
jgi:DNA topoisomerase-1